MALQIVYADIAGDIRAERSSSLCDGISGNMTIDSLVYSAIVMYDEGSVVLANADISVNNLEVEFYGDFTATLYDLVIQLFEATFIEVFENDFLSGFESTLVPALSAIMVEERSCE